MPLGRTDSEAVLSEYLADLLARPLPPMPRPPQRQPINRRWSPEAGAWPHSIAFTSRHPLFEECARSVREVTPDRPSRVAKIGWRGVFQSVKMAKAMSFRSGVELSALKQSEADPSVSYFLEQPCAVVINRKLPIAFDLFRYVGNVPWFVVCRSEAAAEKRDKSGIYSTIGKALAAAGYGFEIFTDRHGSLEPLSTNVENILRGRFAELSPLQTSKILLSLQSGGLGLGALRDASHLTMNQLYRAIIERVIYTDILSGSLTEETLVTAIRENIS